MNVQKLSRRKLAAVMLAAAPALPQAPPAAQKDDEVQREAIQRNAAALAKAGGNNQLDPSFKFIP